MFQRSSAPSLNNLTGVCCYAYSFLEHVNLQAHLYHRPQNTAIACPLVTNGQKNQIIACWEFWTQPKESSGSIVLQFKKSCWNKGKTSVSHVLWRHVTSNALQWRLLQNPDCISRHFLIKCRSGWPLCIVYWYLDSFKWEVKIEMFMAIRHIAKRMTLIIAKCKSGWLMQPK